MAIEVRYSRRALRDLLSIYTWVAGRAGHAVAAQYVSRIEARCLSLANFPRRGSPRAGSARSIPFERRAIITYRVHARHVMILGIYHSGREPD